MMLNTPEYLYCHTWTMMLRHHRQEYHPFSLLWTLTAQVKFYLGSTKYLPSSLVPTTLWIKGQLTSGLGLYKLPPTGRFPWKLLSGTISGLRPTWLELYRRLVREVVPLLCQRLILIKTPCSSDACTGIHEGTKDVMFWGNFQLSLWN